jgi:hypothetical protein
VESHINAVATILFGEVYLLPGAVFQENWMSARSVAYEWGCFFANDK